MNKGKRIVGEGFWERIKLRREYSEPKDTKHCCSKSIGVSYMNPFLPLCIVKGYVLALEAIPNIS